VILALMSRIHLQRITGHKKWFRQGQSFSSRLVV
jgi:hypothetical protein